MKKRVLAGIFALCMGLTACGKEPSGESSEGAQFDASQVMPEYDAQNQYLTVTACSFQEKDGVFLGTSFMDKYLHYYDGASGVSGVLCADPACTHDSIDCGAYVGAGATVSCYDGKLYWVAEESYTAGDYYLWRGDLSGRNREKVKPIGWEEIILTYQPQQYVVHRERLYILGRTQVVSGTEAGYRVALLSTSLDSSEDFAVLYDKTFPKGGQTTVLYVKNAVYLSFASLSEDMTTDILVERYDISGGNWETVYEEKGIEAYIGNIWVTGEETVYIPGSYENSAYVWKVENGQRKQVLFRESDGAYTPWITGDVVVGISQVDNIRWAEITTLSGQTLYKGKLFPEEIPGMEIDPNQCGLALIGADEEKLILNLTSMDSTDRVEYTIKLNITDSMNPTILWSSQE